MKTEAEIRDQIAKQRDLIELIKEGSILFHGREEEIIRTHEYAIERLEWVLA